MVIYGPSAKQLGKIAKGLNFRAVGPESIDTKGYYEDGKRIGKRGLRCDSGSLRLKENRDAFVAGYCAGVNGF